VSRSPLVQGLTEGLSLKRALEFGLPIGEVEARGGEVLPPPNGLLPRRDPFDKSPFFDGVEVLCSFQPISLQSSEIQEGVLC